MAQGAQSERAMARSDSPSRIANSPARYPFALLLTAVALGFALLGYRYQFHDVEVPLFLLAIALTAWYAGPRPTVLALALSIVLFDYFFTEPRFTLYVRSSDVPYLVIFICFASLVAWFSAVRRRVETALVRARDDLQAEVAERTKQACSI